MASLHLTKVAVGCGSREELDRRQSERAANGEVTITTRYRPKRHDELIGGSIFWIIKRKLAVRQEILGFAEAEDGRWNIRLKAQLIPVRARPKRPHQGWRYLAGSDAPADLGGGSEGIAALPPEMIEELAKLALI